MLIGNPLTLAIIEFFAVPCALLGAALYPLGLDAFVWRYLGLGIDLITYLAKLIAAAPGAGRRWAGPYIKISIPADPWGRPFRYQSPGRHNTASYDLWSLGPDGRDGTPDDIGNWPSE